MAKGTMWTLAMVMVVAAGCGRKPLAEEGCDFAGSHYDTGDVFVGPDGCNSCTCNPDQTMGVVCDSSACGQGMGICLYGIHSYGVGHTFPAGDGCNSCTCQQDGTVACSSDDCPPPPPADDGGDGDGDGGGDTPPWGDDQCGWEGTVCGALCVNLSSDPMHCGSCDNACAFNEVCSGSGCICHPDNRCGNTCADFQNDPNHCGFCDNKCENGCHNGLCY